MASLENRPVERVLVVDDQEPVARTIARCARSVVLTPLERVS